MDLEKVLDKWIEWEVIFIEEVEVFEGIYKVLYVILESGVVIFKNVLEMEKGFYLFNI